MNVMQEKKSLHMCEGSVSLYLHYGRSSVVGWCQAELMFNQCKWRQERAKLAKTGDKRDPGGPAFFECTDAVNDRKK